jgi:uncharacterized caspase-like protein
LLFVAGFAPLQASAEPRLALVIANSAYAGGLDPLANPVNDGKLIAGTLQKLGFTVTLVTDADQKKMKRAVSDFGEALGDAGPTASALFYYAGHGLQVDGQNYLIPINADIRREADVDLEAVSAEAVLKQMEYAAPSTSIVILDACRNNPLARGMRSATRGLARMDAPNGSYVAYSTAPGQTAADGAGKNSPFATALVAEMMKAGQGIEESFRNVRVTVSKATNGEQTPWDSSSLMSSFYFAGDAKQAAVIATPVPEPVAPSPAAPLPTPATSAPGSGVSDADMAFWDSVKNSTEAEDYAAYLKKFPDGNFAELALARKAGLEQKAANRTVPTPTTAAPTPVEVAAIEIPEPEFESPLADGTIVLSPKTKAALDQYLAQSHAGQGDSTLAYFYVSVDGRAFGQTVCNTLGRGGSLPGATICPQQAGVASSRGDSSKVKAKAVAACNAQAKTECVLLFAGDSQKNEFKPLQ